MRVKEPTAWVVFRSGAPGRLAGGPAVCTQSEWDIMQTSQPGVHVLIRGNIGNEGEAERLARDSQAPPAAK